MARDNETQSLCPCGHLQERGRYCEHCGRDIWKTRLDSISERAIEVGVKIDAIIGDIHDCTYRKHDNNKKTSNTSERG